MRHLIKSISVFILWIMGFWGLGVLINTIIFHSIFDMNPTHPEYVINEFFMTEINKFLFIPAFFIAKKINEQTIF